MFTQTPLPFAAGAFFSAVLRMGAALPLQKSTALRDVPCRAVFFCFMLRAVRWGWAKASVQGSAPA